MIVDRYDPINLFELVPKLRLQFEPELAELDRLLDDDALFETVKADLSRRRPNSVRLGRHSTPVEVILRMLVVKRLYGWSYEQTEHFVSDSIVLRQFCRLYLESAPDDTTLIRWAKLIGAQTVAALNERAVELARSLKVTRGRKLRTDATVVETNIHHPTDDALLADGVRVISRLLKRAKGFVEVSIQKEQKGEPFRDRTRSAKRLAHKIGRMALRRTEQAQVSYQASYRRLVEVAKASIKQAGRVRTLIEEVPSARKISEEISHFAQLLEQTISQTCRRVFEGERVSAKEKLVSVFEEHTSIIRRGKARKQTEFGRKVWLSEVDGGIVSGFRILEGNSSDEAQLEPALEDHLRLFGRAPELVAADRSVHSKENERIAREMGVKKVCLPKAGKKSAEREEHERQRWFKRARRFRAGIEGRISVMKRREYLGRCRDRGEEGFGRWVGWGVLTANLSTIARTLAAR
ncbi:MAG: ISNCY family transposase [Rubrobacteraceae bacterium]|nr:ISNCY family transposase [Rubrobacteraceae bacterium]